MKAFVESHVNVKAFLYLLMFKNTLVFVCMLHTTIGVWLIKRMEERYNKLSLNCMSFYVRCRLICMSVVKQSLKFEFESNAYCPKRKER